MNYEQLRSGELPKAALAIIHNVDRYLGAMGERTPSAIHLNPKQYETVLRSHNAWLSRLRVKPVQKVSYKGIPVEVSRG